MTRQALIGRRLRYIGILTGVIFLIAGCPLPFQFTPDDASGNIAASNDPANPLVTAAPTLRIVENTSGQDTTDTTPAADVAIFFESETRGASIFYRTDGQAPEPGNAGTTRYSSDAPVRLAGHASAADIRAIAIGPGMYPSLITEQTVTVTYNQLDAPTFSPAPGAYSAGQSVTISGPAGATIYYTVVDGVGPAPDPVPGQSGTQQYTDAIVVSGDGTVKSVAAIAVQDERLDSSVSRGTWGIAATVEPVAITPETETFTGVVTVSLATATPDATIYYTLDGSDPSDAANPDRIAYDNPFAVSESLTVSASAEKPGYGPAPITSRSYTIAVAPVAITPEGETHTFLAVVSLATPTPEATIYYTLDGSDPSDAANPNRISYESSFVIYESRTVRAWAERAGYDPSPITEKSYTITATGFYDDFEDGQLDPIRWTPGTAAFGSIEESDSFFRAPHQTGSTDGNITANVYGFRSAGGTGWARLDSIATGNAWAFTVVEEQMGAEAGNVQGWAIRAKDPGSGSLVNLITHYNDTDIYLGANTPTNANYVLGGDSVGDYAVRKVGTSLEVYLNGELLRTLDGSTIGPEFQISVWATNAWGVNVSYAAVAIDDVVLVE